MLAGPLVFVDIDTQRDFLEPGGALFIPGAEILLANLARLTEFAWRRSIPVLATACAHSLDDPELQRFRPHCLIGTRGQTRVAATDWLGSLVLGPDDRLEGALPPHLTLQKHALDLFSHPDADRLIGLYQQAAGPGVTPQFVVYGVATDYCVRCAVEGLLARGCHVAVVADAIRAIDAAAEPEVLRGFLDRGAILVATEVVCADGMASAETLRHA